MGITTNEFPSSNIVEDWPYIRFNDVFDLRFLPVDDHSNLRELVAKVQIFSNWLILILNSYLGSAQCFACGVQHG